MTTPNVPAWIVITAGGIVNFDNHQQAEDFAANYASLRPGQNVVLYAFQRNFRCAPPISEPHGTLQ